jgi:acetyl esterase/lipase
MVAFAPDYRVYSRQRTLPFSAVSDAKSAIRWVRAHATEFGINPDRIVAAGGSAGGHISACAAIIEDFEDPGQDLTVSSRPNALVLFNPALDTSPIAGSVGELKMAAASSISPVDHIRGGLPPTIVFHGTADESCPYENSERFCRLMKEAGNDCELFGYEGATHGFHNHSSFRKEGKGDNKYYFDTLAKTDAFLERIGFLPKPPRAAEEKKDQ